MENKDNNKPDTSNIPKNDPSKAMDSKKEVEQSNDEKTDEDFPGYPHYPAKEDIMNTETANHRADVDVENIPNNRNNSGVDQRFPNGKEQDPTGTAGQRPSDDDSVNIKTGNETDLTNDDITLLNTIDRGETGMPTGIHDELNTDLDIPGSELDDANEMIGEEDEENNYYSLGGDRHDDQESDPSESW